MERSLIGSLPTQKFLLESLKPCTVALFGQTTGWVSADHVAFRNALTHDRESAGSASETHLDTGENDRSAAH